MWGCGIYIIGACLVVGMVHGLSFPVNLEHLSTAQKSDISGLRELVKHELTEDYMADDVYLAKWLHETNVSVPAAQKLIQQNLEWRAKENINSILNENWDDMNAQFPYTRQTKDMSGRPLLYFNLNDWNIAKFFAEENSADKKMCKYFVKLLEESEESVRQLRAQGEPVTQFNLIINMGGYSLEKHACVNCFYFYRKVGENLANHFPHATERILLVNAPFLFKASYDYLVDKNRHSINVYGQAQDIWEQELLEIIDRDQFPVGLLEDNLPEKDNSEGFMDWYKNEL